MKLAEYPADMQPTVDPKTCPRGQLTPAFFAKLKKGDVVMLYYWATNRGEMLWKHDHFDEDGLRAYGQFDDDRDETLKWCDKVAGYIYEFCGVMTRGSGAEPVHAHKPTRCDI